MRFRNGNDIGVGFGGQQRPRSIAILAGCFSAVLVHVLPSFVGEALSQAIQGAESPNEIRTRIEEYYLQNANRRVSLVLIPWLAITTLAVLALWELKKMRRSRSDHE